MDHLDEMFEVFASWQTMLVCLGVFLAVFAVRRVLETALGDKLKQNKWWYEVALPLMPIVIGASLGALAKNFPWPMVIGDNIWARIMYGGICGLSSGWVYSRFRSIMKTWNSGSDSATADSPPPAVVVSLKPEPVETPEPPTDTTAG
jgi:hypothetical protein